MIERHAGGTGVLYGSVSTKDITSFIKQNYGVVVDSKRVIINTAIKKIGNYDIFINIGDLQVKMFVIVSVSMDDCKKILKDLLEAKNSKEEEILGEVK